MTLSLRAKIISLIVSISILLFLVMSFLTVLELPPVITLVIIGMTVALCITIGIVFANSFTKSLQKLALAANRIAEGNLSLDNQVIIKSQDELGQLAKAFNSILENNRNLIAKVKTTAADLADKAELITGSTNEVASSSSEQANIAQEVTRAIGELSQSTEAIAANSISARKAGDTAFRDAKESSESVRESIQSINATRGAVAELEKYSKRIGDILQVIDDIADQTNLLALNAAIEAARAGEHGKSFTVVAEAVRSLAEKASSSTQEVAQLVDDTQEKIKDAVNISEDGATRASSAIGALDNIFSQIESIVGQLGEISAAGEQQAASTEEVTASMESLSATSEEVSASSQEMAGSAKMLSGLGNEMRKLVEHFSNV